jgi:endo-1,4-beta-xylanase
LALASTNCHGVNIWGFSDLHSWIPQYMPGMGAATLFDADYRPKPDYHSIEELLSK